MRIELNPFEELTIVYNNTEIHIGTGVTDSSRITVSVDPRCIKTSADEKLGYVTFEGPPPARQTSKELFAKVVENRRMEHGKRNIR